MHVPFLEGKLQWVKYVILVKNATYLCLKYDY